MAPMHPSLKSRNIRTSARRADFDSLLRRGPPCPVTRDLLDRLRNPAPFRGGQVAEAAEQVNRAEERHLVNPHAADPAENAPAEEDQPRQPPLAPGERRKRELPHHPHVLD